MSLLNITDSSVLSYAELVDLFGDEYHFDNSFISGYFDSSMSDEILEIITNEHGFWMKFSGIYDDLWREIAPKYSLAHPINPWRKIEGEPIYQSYPSYQRVDKGRKPFKYDSSCEWDIRFLFYLPKKNYVRPYLKNYKFQICKDPFKRILGYINNKPLFGPLTKAKHYSNMRKIKDITKLARLNHRRHELAMSLKNKYRYLNYLSPKVLQSDTKFLIDESYISGYLDGKPLFGPITLHMAQQLDRRHVTRKRSWCDSSQFRQCDYVPCGVVKPRDPALLLRLRMKILELVNKRIKNKLFDLFSRIKINNDKINNSMFIDSRYCSGCAYKQGNCHCVRQLLIPQKQDEDGVFISPCSVDQTSWKDWLISKLPKWLRELLGINILVGERYTVRFYNSIYRETVTEICQYCNCNRCECKFCVLCTSPVGDCSCRNKSVCCSRCDEVPCKCYCLRCMERYIYCKCVQSNRCDECGYRLVECECCVHCNKRDCECLDPQMDKDVEEAPVSINLQNDVAILEQREYSTEDGPIFSDRSWTKLTTTEPLRSLPEFDDRTLLFDTIAWTTNNDRGTVLREHILPVDVLRGNPNAPLCRLFQQHKFWRGDLVVEVHMNANEVMNGQIIMAWYYGACADVSYSARKNIFGLSQMMHTIAQASSSSPQQLRIPYAYMYPFMSTVQRPCDNNILDMGRLIIMVLNPLCSTTVNSNIVNFSLFLRLENSEFVGMVDRSLAFSQMDPFTTVLAINVAEKYLVNSFSDANRDNPPAINQPTPVQILQAGNLSHGNGIVEPINVMRLNPTGQMPYIGLNRNSMFLKDITRVFGLLEIIPWEMNDAAGTGLGRWTAAPVAERTVYKDVLVGDIAYKHIPPVAYAASLFRQWRGPLEYRFDFVCSHMYSGSVLVAYIPGYTKDNITINQAKASTHVIFNLQENHSFTFVTPFITDRPWWPRQYAAGDKTWDFEPPGNIYMFVLNSLVLNSLLTNKIEINVYVRGGESFELSVPCMPSISTSLYQNYPTPPPSLEHKAVEGYYPYYLGTSRYFEADRYALFRYSSFDDKLTYFANLRLDAYYDFGREFEYRDFAFPDDPKQNKKTRYAVAVKDPGNEYYWLAPTPNEVSAKYYAQANRSKSTFDKDTVFIRYPNDDKDGFWDGNPNWTEITTLTLEDFVMVDGEGERDEASRVSVEFSNLLSTNFGFTTFGENFSSLTDLLRRFQYYNTYKNKSYLNLNVTPFVPPFASSETTRAFAREGLISLIAVGYRFFRGGMRIKLTANTNFPTSVTIQHWPDHYTSATSAPNLYERQGYATYVQDPFNNPIISLEVPYYLDSVYGYLAHNVLGNTDYARTNNLGSIKIFCDKALTFKVYYSLADDAKFEVFQGFPPVKFLDTAILQPQQGEDEIVDSIPGPSGLQAEGAVQSLLKDISATKEAADEVKETAKSVKTVFDKANSFIDEASKIYDNTVSKVSDFITKDMFISIISQFAHMFANCNLSSMVIGITTIVIHLLKIDYSWFSKFNKVLQDFVAPYWSSQQNETELVPQGDCPPDSTALLGVLSAMVAAGLGWAYCIPGQYLNTIRRLFWDFNIFSRGLEGLSKLIDIILKSIVKMVSYIRIFKKDNKPDVHALLAEHGKEMIEWAIECEDLMDPDRYSEREADEMFVDRVYDLYLRSCVYSAQLAACTGHSNAATLVRMFSTRLRELRDRLIKQGKHPFTRITPFSLWLTGKPGCGKSTLVTSLSQALLKSINYKEKKMPIYKIEPTNDHWDNCSNQPIFQVDDAFCIRSAQAMEKQLSVYFNVVTNAPFTPPMAHLENKYLRVNPLVLISCSNVAYPRDPAIAEPTALYRRRHAMYEVEIKPTFEKVPGFFVGGNIHPNVLPEDQRNSFAWLRFKKYANPREESPNPSTTVFDTYDAFIADVTAEFKRFHTAEVEAFSYRVKQMTETINDSTHPAESALSGVRSAKERIFGMLKQKKQDVKDFIEKNAPSFKKQFPDSNLEKINSELVEPQGLPSVKPYIVKEFIQANLNVRETPHQGAVEVDCPIDRVASALKSIFTDVDQEEVENQLIYRVLEKYSDFKRIFPSEVSSSLAIAATVRTYQCKCMEHCECAFVMRIRDTDVLVLACDKHEPQARTLTFCGQDCKLNDPANWVATYKYYKNGGIVESYLQQLKVQRSGMNVVARTLAATIGISYKLAKTTLSLSFKIIKKTCKILVKYVLPLVGVMCVGNALLWRYTKPESVARVAGTTIGTVARGYEKLIELFDYSGKKYLVPENATYDASTNTRGTGKLMPRNLVAKTLQAQGDEPVFVQKYQDAAIDVCLRNMYHLSVLYNKDGKVYAAKARGIFIRGRQFLTVKHCWDDLVYKLETLKGKLYLVKTPSTMLELDINKIKCLPFNESNLCVLQLPPQVNEHKNIVKFIPTLDQHRRITNNGVLLETKDVPQIHGVHINFCEQVLTVGATPTTDAVPLVGSYKYNYGAPGVCGSVLLCNDTNPCLVGMHVAGRGTFGYSEPLVREMFEDVPVPKRECVDVVLPKLEDLDLNKVELDGNFLQLGTVEAQYAHNESGKTSIVPSLCHGIFEVMTQPGPLSPSDPRLPPGSSPMRDGVEKHGQPILGFPPKLLNFARLALSAELKVKVKPVIGTDPVSLQEAICGRPGVQGFSPLNFSSSEGFPFSAHRPAEACSKKWLFDLEITSEGYRCHGIHSKLVNVMVIKQRLREKNIKPFTVFVDCLKDARIPKEKCSTPGKTRIFSISPVDFSIQFRQYFLPYTVAHQNSRSVFSTAVGINVHGEEWTNLVLSMGQHSPHQLCGDYSNFGAGFSADVHEIVGDCLLEWFDFHGQQNESERTVRSVLLSELLNSYHLCFNTIYQVYSGMPSGSPITVETNDLVNFCYVAMAWHEIMRDSGLNSHYHFNKYVKIKTYGDDLWLSVHPFVIEKFNNCTIEEFFRKYNVKYTDADKSGTIIPFKSLDEVSFLKHQPVPHPTRPNMFLAQLDLRSALDVANWCWKSKDMTLATLVNLEACSDSLYGHGPQVHSHYRQILQDEANRLGHIGRFRSWEELDDLFLGEHGDLLIQPFKIKV
uniref:Genome polyprotein n=1 Tax=Jinan Picor tick virus 1 TaxID=2972305 RepID=A0A9E8AD56_9PICO|nr:MAG: polyprotein [Jinan Picor tick virus 1]